MNNSLRQFIKVYDDILDEDLCEFLILCFDMAKNKHEVVKNDKICFTQLNLSFSQSDLNNTLVRKVQDVISQYRQDMWEETAWWPKNTLALEEFRIKRYNGGTQDCFETHVDVGDHNSARRYLALLFYLNDNFYGGETKFLPRKYIKPKAGSVLVFPPTWQYPHAGLKVLTGTKYIMSTYLHYT